jgi:hypothetical protein
MAWLPQKIVGLLISTFFIIKEKKTGYKRFPLLFLKKSSSLLSA